MKNSMLMTVLLAAALVAGCGDTEANKGSSDAPRSDTTGAAIEAGAVGSYPAALAEARDTGRNVLIVYGSTTCPWSRKMDEETLADGEVRAALRDFVVLKIDQGRNAAEFEKAWGKQTTPTVMTLDAEGKPIGRKLSGVVGKTDFLAYAAWAKSGTGPQPGIATGGG